MNKLRILIVTSISCILIATLVAVSLNLHNKNSYMDKLNNMKNSTLASIMISASTFDELVDLSDIIIEGKAVDYEPEIQDGIVYTIETVEVKKVLKGNVSEGNKVKITFTGGELNGMTTPPMKDCPIMDMRGNYMLFLKTNDGVRYFVVGGNQGFGLIKDNKIEATQEGELGDVIKNYKVDKLEKDINVKIH